MELTMACVEAIEAAIHVGDAIVATMHHAMAAIAPSSSGASAEGHASAPATCRC